MEAGHSLRALEVALAKRPKPEQCLPVSRRECEYALCSIMRYMGNNNKTIALSRLCRTPEASLQVAL